MTNIFRCNWMVESFTSCKFYWSYWRTKYAEPGKVHKSLTPLTSLGIPMTLGHLRILQYYSTMVFLMSPRISPRKILEIVYPVGELSPSLCPPPQNMFLLSHIHLHCYPVCPLSPNLSCKVVACLLYANSPSTPKRFSKSFNSALYAMPRIPAETLHL